jgi:hypothetical protein
MVIRDSAFERVGSIACLPLPFERPGNQLCLNSLVKAIRVRVESLANSLVVRDPDHFFSHLYALVLRTPERSSIWQTPTSRMLTKTELIWP